jgi:hypothetical protein
MKKKCGRCGEEKSLNEFHRRRTGRQAWCKPCRRLYDAQYHQKTRERRIKQKRVLHDAFVTWCRSLKEGKPCADCAKIFHPVAMQWDHLPGTIKNASLGDLTRRHNRRRVLEEIGNCELVCANCHAVRTLNRQRGVAQPG